VPLPLFKRAKVSEGEAGKTLREKLPGICERLFNLIVMKIHKSVPVWK